MNDPTDGQPTTAYWEQQVQAWKRSDLSQAKFCKLNKLVYHQFIYWRAKSECVTTTRQGQKNNGGFARVNVQPVLTDELTLSLPNGFIFRGINTENVAVVRELLNQL